MEIYDALITPPSNLDEEVGYLAPDAGRNDALRAMARTCFAETFSHLCDQESFERFLDEVYGEGGSMSRDLLDPSIEWLIADVRGQIVGYAKVRPLVAPATNPQKGSLELQQIYVLRNWHGRGVANRLMGWALERAQDLNAPEIYLTVFNHNERAKRFYTRYGFVDVGHCPSRMGSRVADDRIWKKILEPKGAASQCHLPTT